MSKNKKDKIGKILEYILCVKPFEFSLVPDENGYVKIKDLLKAVHETKDLRWISKGEINSHIALSDNPAVEIEGNRIRSTNPDKSAYPEITSHVPGQLYIAVRKKAWPHINEKGLYREDSIVLSSDKDKALTLGKRTDNDPLLLFVSSRICTNKGVSFKKFGDDLYIADFLPKTSLSGPSVEKVTVEIKKDMPKKEKKPVTPGTFTPNVSDIFRNAGTTDNSKSWKKNKKKFRREKKNFWPDQ